MTHSTTMPTPMDLSLHEELRKERTFAICGLPAEQLYIPMEELWKQDLEQKNPDNTLTKFIKQQHDRHDKEHGKPTTALRQAILKSWTAGTPADGKTPVPRDLFGLIPEFMGSHCYYWTPPIAPERATWRRIPAASVIPGLPASKWPAESREVTSYQGMPLQRTFDERQMLMSSQENYLVYRIITEGRQLGQVHVLRCMTLANGDVEKHQLFTIEDLRVGAVVFDPAEHGVFFVHGEQAGHLKLAFRFLAPTDSIHQEVDIFLPSTVTDLVKFKKNTWVSLYVTGEHLFVHVVHSFGVKAAGIIDVFVAPLWPKSTHVAQVKSHLEKISFRQIERLPPQEAEIVVIDVHDGIVYLGPQGPAPPAIWAVNLKQTSALTPCALFEAHHRNTLQGPTAEFRLVTQGDKAGIVICSIDHLDQQQHLHLYDINRKTLSALAPGFKGIFEFGGSSPGADSRLLVGYKSVMGHNKTYLLDPWLQSGSMAPLTPDEVKPHLDSADEDLKQHNFTFKSFDGKDVPVMLIANSKATRDAPLLMSVYGGFGRCDPQATRPDHNLLSFLRATRMHFAFVAVRGGGEKGEAWHQAGVKQHQADAVRDVLAASAFFRSQDSHQLHGKLPHGHVTRIVLHGVSHGACLSISALNKDPAAFAMVIGDLGIYDLVRYRNPHFKTDERTSAYIIQYGDPSTRDIFWIRSLSPLNTVNRTDKHHNKLPPIMLRAIAKDPIHHPVHSLKQLAELHWWHSANEHPVILGWTKARQTPAEYLDWEADKYAFIYHQLKLTGYGANH